ncbi:ATP phosphoribosyltransferase regulatory subunit [Marinomonas mediterranea]|jgi:ATP phosphoribosyltransferase, regulatory subunit|uniref:ATP phosphoribosyltransferase regulatory subunit n=1 Tax=Marinomonas mediterranea (strain ATCC 700492 / JCM 21426 / NBRC 103028 / MMB-1) TaxID=717774 RepID=F2JWL1_MARM1|nr:ATP phosphoribosyltransferase regulatory subunit [Marinomonas mediterranea]ADZ91775.1 ATP phosphoribosyltransferase regulatory subunit [Marinomonas mediterranea MMB-1]WCN17868.1 ATP phosphoribosyltransferase regulatory subunit [Marinomonas mediterranea MMB-1]
MALADRWLLPDGVDEALPEKAAQIEHLRRSLLNLHESWGYKLVIPPLIEYLDSLLTGAGSDLEIETFKVIDQLSGRLMGIRADFTSQVARIDAHCLKEEDIQRLSYSGSVLRTVPAGLDGTRSPIQLGAELYGHGGLESDLEILSLMLETLRVAGLEKLVLDIGHVDIVRGVIEAAGLSEADQVKLSELYKAKDLPELEVFVAQLNATDRVKSWLTALPRLCGGVEVLAKASSVLDGVSKSVSDAIDMLNRVVEVVKSRFPQIGLHFDLSDLVSYSYHTGLVFAAYQPGHGNAIARGGRYNNIGEVFGRSRPATGFSTDLKTLVSLSQPNVEQKLRVLSPVVSSAKLWDKLNKLRQEGYQVVEQLDDDVRVEKFDFQLVDVDGDWQLQAVSK